MNGGNKLYYPMNIHLKNGRLHYVEAGLVKEAKPDDILVIEIGEDRFTIVDGKVMQILARTEKGFVAGHITLDMNSLKSSQGAYGTSTTTESTRKYSSLDIADNIGLRHAEIRMGKDDGQELDIMCKYYIVTGGKVYPANKRQIEKMLPSERIEEFKSFVKANKIKWKKPEKLALLIDFLSGVEIR